MVVSFGLQCGVPMAGRSASGLDNYWRDVCYEDRKEVVENVVIPDDPTDTKS